MPFVDTKGLEPFADLMKEIYGDLAKPGVTQIGIALATVIGLINTCLSPIKLLNEKTELNRQKNLTKLAKRFSEIPMDEILEAPPEIAIPIAEKLVYVNNDELSNLYIELLAKASSNDLNSTAHPSFVSIINSLSPDEAILLKHLHLYRNNSIACLEVRLVNIIDNSFDLLSPYYTEYDQHSELMFQDNAPAYVSNLIGLGILQHSELALKEKSHYLDLEKKLKQDVEKAKIDLSEDRLKHFCEKERIDIFEMQIFITPFGELFLKAIMPPINDL